MVVAWVTSPALASGECSNQDVRAAQGALALPDCRAYELASPQQKNGADVIGFPVRTRAASSGSAVQFASSIGFGDARGSGLSFDYLSVREGTAGTQGWSTHAITPGGLEALSAVDLLVGGADQIYRGEMSDDLSRGVFGAFSSLTAGSPDTDGFMNLYLRSGLLSPGAGSSQLVTDCPACSAPLPGIPALDLPEVAGASADFSHVLFESTQNLTADAAGLDPTVVKTYEWSDGTVRLAGILPDGTPAPSSEAGPGVLISSSTAPLPATYAPNAISRDGSRIYFTDPVANPTAGRLYLRTGNSTASASTVQVNVAEPTPSASPVDDARFWTATPDGSKVLFTTGANLLAADTGNATDLYMYDADKPSGHHLTLISAPDAGLSADVRGVLGVSDDGSYVYFASDTQLLSGQPTTSANRIYVWHDGTIHEVAAIAENDAIPIVGGSWRSDPKASRVTPDGTRLVFVSKNAGGGAVDDLAHSGVGDACTAAGGCEEVYTYDARTNAPPVCVSCTSSDGPGQTDASFLSTLGFPPIGLTSHLNHPLSTDGRYVFFTTGDRLVPEDRDGSAPDVYEYDTVGGQVHLLSSGRPGSLGSYFMDAGVDGRDAFFVTRDRLNGWDGDNQVDLYDARIDGGLPEPQSPPIACAGDACHGAPGVTVSEGSAASSAIVSGNPRPKAKSKPLPHCRKGQVRKRVHGKVRCVKRLKAKKAHKAAKHAAGRKQGR